MLKLKDLSLTDESKKVSSSKEWRKQQSEDRKAEVQRRINLIADWQRSGQLQVPKGLLDKLSNEAFEPRIKLCLQDGWCVYDTLLEVGKKITTYADQRTLESKDYKKILQDRIYCSASFKNGTKSDTLIIHFIPIPLDHPRFSRDTPVQGFEATPASELMDVQNSPLVLPAIMRRAAQCLEAPDRSSGQVLIASVGKRRFLVQDGRKSFSDYFFKHGSYLGSALESFEIIRENQLSDFDLLANELKGENWCIAEEEGL